ncbi:hypothetical protein F5B18DRAFT_607996 [Nemania serpens]|nr:hypothetical protein F5B18DRAFT_607996 [Nemania serpens]
MPLITCCGTTKEGNRCRNAPIKNQTHCRHHGPNRVSQSEPLENNLPIRTHETTSEDTENQLFRNTDKERTTTVVESIDHAAHYNAQTGPQHNNTGSGSQHNNTGSGPQYNNTGSGNQVHGNVNIDNKKTKYGDTINNAINVGKERYKIEQKQSVTYHNYHTYISKFIDYNLEGFQLNKDEFAEKVASLRSNTVNLDSSIDKELIPQVTTLGVFDFMILCDNSTSMKKHKEVLKITLKRLATIANVFTPKGISLRFLNYDKDNGGDFDALSAEDIEKKFNTVEYKSGSQLGTRLKEKIITPILKKAQRGELKKPIIVMLITDGKPHEKNRDALRDAIQLCKQSQAVQKLGRATVLVIVARVGDSLSAKEFLNQLENDDAIKDIVYCSADSLNKQHALLTPGDDISERENMTHLIQLLVAALPQ